MSTLKTNNIQAYTSDTITISSSLVPSVISGSTTSSFSLGSPTAAWKDIYVSNGTITFLPSNTQLSADDGFITNKDIFVASNQPNPSFGYLYNAIRVGAGPYTGSNYLSNVVLGNGIATSNTASFSVGGVTYFIWSNTMIGNAAGSKGQHNGSVMVGASIFSNATSFPTSYNSTFVGVATANFASGFTREATYIGYAAGNRASGSFNTSLGSSAGIVMTGSYNTSIGYYCSPSTLGSNNITIGYAAGGKSQLGIDYAVNRLSTNIFIGDQAASQLTSGSNNTIVGRRAANALGNGNYNTFLGDSAGGSLATGSYNVFIGSDSGYAFGSNVSYSLDVRSGNNSLIKGNFNDQSLDLIGQVSIIGDATTNASHITGSLIVGGGVANSVLAIPTYTSNPSTTFSGSMYYNTSTNLLYIHNGTAWRSASFA